MKNLKKLIPAICMLLVSATMLGTSTYAWFSMNRTVTATGMSVQATASASLVIGTDIPVGTDIVVNFNETTAHVLTPATHDETNGTTANLAYVLNNTEIDAYTGEKSATGKDIVWQNAVNGYIGSNASETTTYYVDYVMFVAASGADGLTGQDIAVAFDADTQAKLELIKQDRDTQNAFSIDIYQDDVADTTTAPALDAYVNTLVARDFTETVVIENVDIPSNADSTYLRIVLRVYIDGACTISDDVEYEHPTAYKSTETYYKKSVSDDGVVTYASQTVTDASDFATKLNAGDLFVKVANTAKDYVYTNTVNTDNFDFGLTFTSAETTTVPSSGT